MDHGLFIGEHTGLTGGLRETKSTTFNGRSKVVRIVCWNEVYPLKRYVIA